MHITKLELQGFKTFAKKTTLTFLPPKGSVHPITAVVGPNGSGKSNVADAIRWVLGEQSLKVLRGKKSEDVIFSGSEGRGRSGFAEVAITMNNEDKAMPVESAEITITRRLYRDGSSEYLVNDRKSRLSDIHLLLAQANVGQKSYSVVGQGMVDHILISSPEERKAFFDDATGVRQFQIKRHESMLKLKRTYENLAEVEMLLNEITPRLRSLKRQAKRLEQREEVETQLRELETGYYGTLWWNVSDKMQKQHTSLEELNKKYEILKGERKALEDKFASLAADGSDDEEEDRGLIDLQKKQSELQRTYSQLRDEHFQAQKEIELTKVRAQSNWAPLPLVKIIEEVQTIKKELETLKDLEELDSLKSSANNLFSRSETLLKKLQRPDPEAIKPDPALLSKLDELKSAQEKVKGEINALSEKIANYAKKEKKVRTDLLEIQQELTGKQKEIHTLEKERNTVSIELARLEERKANLSREMNENLKELASDIQAKRIEQIVNTEELYPEIQRLRYKLELIGGIDPEIIQEYEETQERFDLLNNQFEDLQEAIKATEKIIDELDKEIKKQSEKAFKLINTEFQKFFKILFGGGSCSLIKMTKDEVEEENKVTLDRASEDTAEAERIEHEEDTLVEAIKKRVKEREDRVVGIDIQATPPGKKLKALNLLSGGERALTSIALLSAIMAVNPGPFVLLDEVDAALDEANTFRFANILNELSKLTQFIIVTHNRATMEKADVLYGVTMGNDGVSNLISVNLEDVKDTATARR